MPLESLSHAALTSPVFAKLNASSPFAPVSTSAAQVSDDYGYVVLANFIPDKSAALAHAGPYVVELFYVDKNLTAIGGYRITITKNGMGARVQFLFDDGTHYKYVITADGVLHPIDGAPMPHEILTDTTCQSIVSILCAAAGGGVGYFVCLGLTLTTGLAGLGCDVILGVISTLGCTAATNKLCG